MTTRLAIANSRAKAWTVVTHRRHELTQVFVADKEGREAMWYGQLEQKLKNGKKVTGPFGGRVIVDSVSLAAGKPRLALVEAFAVRPCP